MQPLDLFEPCSYTHNRFLGERVARALGKTYSNTAMAIVGLASSEGRAMGTCLGVSPAPRAYMAPFSHLTMSPCSFQN